MQRLSVLNKHLMLKQGSLASKTFSTNQLLKTVCAANLDEIREAGTFKTERVITRAQGMEIQADGKTVLNFCANNYLGLASHPRVVKAAKDIMDTHGFGMSSVRFICGT